MFTHLFNFTFTRADEAHADVHEVGFSIDLPVVSLDAAEGLLRERNAHLEVLSVVPFAVLTEDGDLIWQGCDPSLRVASVERLTLL